MPGLATTSPLSRSHEKGNGGGAVLEALRIRDFRLLWFARLVSMLGSWLLVVAVPAYLFTLTGSLVATGLTLAAEFLPPVLLGPIAGVLVGRWDRPCLRRRVAGIRP